MREKLIELILDASEAVNENLNTSIKIWQKGVTKLYGKDGTLDSIGLVNLIVEIEERVDDEYAKNIVLADEKAFSQENSPFRDVETLAIYIEGILNNT